MQTRKGRRVTRDTQEESVHHPRGRLVGPGPGQGGEKGSESQNGDVFWNQSQQDLLMDWTWGMSEGESCHARLQVSGLSTWVDGGAFSPKLGGDWGRSRDWGENIKISLQKEPEVFGERVKLRRAVVVGEGCAYPGNAILVKNCHRLLTLCITWQMELWPRFSEVTNRGLGTTPAPREHAPQCWELCQGLRM